MAYIGGLPRHEAITGGCQHHEVLKLIGWACPVCNKGNAPDAKTCGHCAKHDEPPPTQGGQRTWRANTPSKSGAGAGSKPNGCAPWPTRWRATAAW